ncbi:hypothetical protein HOA59_03560 [archaeon]|jgi:hypothetical protein|nr:hypothetical protein [archaeon]MBT6824474.1 hypothetical protein [archaeon]MBT7106859.1 hypothetical protein [archaeon]MBT7297791.1 hypothetical protein [archaeon]
MTIELGDGIIELVNFEIIDPLELSVIKKIIGKFTEDILEKSNSFKKITVELEKDSKYEINISITADRIYTSTNKNDNIFYAVNQALKDILAKV